MARVQALAASEQGALEQQAVPPDRARAVRVPGSVRAHRAQAALARVSARAVAATWVRPARATVPLARAPKPRVRAQVLRVPGLVPPVRA